MYARLDDGSSPRGRGTPLVVREPSLCAPVHPRAGGEHPLRRFILLFMRELRRFIPARAGNTRWTRWRGVHATVHPRAGGEHGRTRCCPKTLGGSSPRGRGTHLDRHGDAHPIRFIPARAGNTTMRRARPSPRAVHPRAGGEHPPVAAVPYAADGSSPRGRGTRTGSAFDDALHRFIPARAGNTLPRGRARAGRAVHPRAGGEHTSAVAVAPVLIGSSPRGRGTPPSRQRRALSDRFIPARAGNTRLHPRLLSQSPVHPRAGGEHAEGHSACQADIGSSPRGREHRTEWSTSSSLPYQIGSSPRGRGTPWPSWPSCPRHPVHPRAGGEHRDIDIRQSTLIRFIPARAGNTGRGCGSGASSRVHPRAGGEHMPETRQWKEPFGSSPRGRGTRARREQVREVGRFIPARAGNTRALPRRP